MKLMSLKNLTKHFVLEQVSLRNLIYLKKNKKKQQPACDLSSKKTYSQSFGSVREGEKKTKHNVKILISLLLLFLF